MPPTPHDRHLFTLELTGPQCQAAWLRLLDLFPWASVASSEQRVATVLAVRAPCLGAARLALRKVVTRHLADFSSPDQVLARVLPGVHSSVRHLPVATRGQTIQQILRRAGFKP